MVVASLVRQFASCLEVMPVEVQDLYRKLRPKGRKPDVFQLCSVLGTVSKNFKRSFVLLDGLDECRDKVIPSILKLVSTIRKHDFRIFLTARPHVKIDRFIQDHHADTAEISIFADGNDVQAYLSHRLAQNSFFSPEFKDDVMDVVSGRTQGM
jgi:hypothetical protein